MPLLRFGYSAFSWANAKFFRRNGVIFWATPLFLKPYSQGIFAFKMSRLANAVVGTRIDSAKKKNLIFGLRMAATIIENRPPQNLGKGMLLFEFDNHPRRRI